MLKKYMTFCAIAMIAFSSCQDQISAPAADDEASCLVEKTFYSVDGFTKVLLNNTQVLWEKGDEIDVLWDGGKASAVADPYNSSLEASFKTYVSEGAQTFYAVHPSSETSSLVDGKVNVEVPSVQDGTFSSASIAAARADADDFLVFRHLVSFVEFTIDKCGTLTFSCGSDITGGVTATFDEDGALLDYTQSGSGDVITVDIPCSGTYYIALLPEVEMEYLSFTLTSGSVTEYILSTKPKTMTRGKLIGLGNITDRFNAEPPLTGGVEDLEISEFDW
ncbi:MAG: hypothetical protein IKB85_03620 [Bacteroidales bacterium]|nr:hypothetical protein [Bacteroidales bacterium]